MHGSTRPVLISRVPVLDAFCDLFDLSPRVQWREALRIQALPLIPERITLIDPPLWQKTEAAFARGNPSDAEHWTAAALIMLDLWLWLGFETTAWAKSPFAALVQLTQALEHPALRVAHCLRDIMMGNEFRLQDLDAMIHSPKPEYERLFQEAFRVDSPTKKGKIK